MIQSVLESGEGLCDYISEHDSDSFSLSVSHNLFLQITSSISSAIMTAITLVLRSSNALNVKSSTQPLKPLLRSASAPLVPSPTREVQPHQAQIATGLPRSIFRSNSTSLELEDMWTLKRASPVFDLDDEDVEESLESPSKRVRTFFIPFPEERDSESSSRQRLPWDCKIREDENGFHLEL